MKKNKILILLFLIINMNGFSQTKTIHVFVALCNDNSQFVTPISPNHAIGSMPETNIFWGAENGVLNYFENKAENWILLKKDSTKKDLLLESALFRHKTKNIYLLAEAYNGKKTNEIIKHYLLATSGQNNKLILYNNDTLKFGGSSNLTAYIGLNGLINEGIKVDSHLNSTKKETIVLCSYSKIFFERNLELINAYPLLWTKQIMNPEAYILEATFDSWLNKDNPEILLQKVANIYNLYQRCGVNAATKVFYTGF